MAHVVLLMFWGNALKYDVIQSRKPKYIYLYYIIVRFDEVCVSFMDSETASVQKASRSFETRQHAKGNDVHGCMLNFIRLSFLNKFSRFPTIFVEKFVKSANHKKAPHGFRPLHKGSEQVRLTMRQGQRVVSWWKRCRDAKQTLNTKHVTEVTSLDVGTSFSKFVWLY